MSELQYSENMTDEQKILYTLETMRLQKLELLKASGPFRFEVPPEISDDESLGVIRGIHIYAGELRRLNIENGMRGKVQ